MIYGLTVDEAGAPIQRLAISAKVSIGEPAKDGQSFPSKSDHFRVLKKDGKGEWVEDTEFYRHLCEVYMKPVSMDDGSQRRPPLREFDVVFLNDDIEAVFRTENAWWGKSEKKCSGDGRDAQRSVTALTTEQRKDTQVKEGQRSVPWKPCGDACPEMKNGSCKPSGSLYFIFKDRPTLGSIATYHTTSHETIKRIVSSLLQIQTVTGHRLKGIPLKMVLRPGKTRYLDPKDGKPRVGSAYFVNIEFRQDDYKTLIPMLIEQSASYERSIVSAGNPKLLTADNEEEVIDVEQEPEEKLAGQMTNEFYPDNRAEKSTEKSASTPTAGLMDVAVRLGLTGAHVDTIVNSMPNHDSLGWLLSFESKLKALDAKPSQTVELFGVAIAQGLDAMKLPEAPKAPGKRTAKKPPETPAAQTPEPPAQKQETATAAEVAPSDLPEEFTF